MAGGAWGSWIYISDNIIYGMLCYEKILLIFVEFVDKIWNVIIPGNYYIS